MMAWRELQAHSFNCLFSIFHFPIIIFHLTAQALSLAFHAHLSKERASQISKRFRPMENDKWKMENGK
jgi:hypothetical protein